MKNIILSIVSMIVAILSLLSISWLAVFLFGDIETARAYIKDSDVYNFGGATIILVFICIHHVRLAVGFIFDYISTRKSRPEA